MRTRGAGASALAAKLLGAGGAAKWSGINGLKFHAGGMLDTPWGAGTWGVIKAGAEAGQQPVDQLFADFIGQQHVVSLHADGWPKLHSMRCADFENVTVTVL